MDTGLLIKHIHDSLEKKANNALRFDFNANLHSYRTKACGKWRDDHERD